MFAPKATQSIIRKVHIELPRIDVVVITPFDLAYSLKTLSNYCNAWTIEACKKFFFLWANMDLREEDRFPAILSDLKSSFFLSSTKKSELDLFSLSALRSIYIKNKIFHMEKETAGLCIYVIKTYIYIYVILRIKLIFLPNIKFHMLYYIVVV